MSPFTRTDVMSDLETLSTRANAAWLTIGAIKFDPFGDITLTFGGRYPTLEEMQANLDCFYQRVDYADMKPKGFHVDQGTVDWWMKQKEEVRAEAFNPADRMKIEQVLDEYYLWFGNAEKPWSHGANFDNKLIEDACSIMGRKPPFFFTEGRCTRTPM